MTCNCEQKAIKCSPTEGFEHLVSCDNSQSSSTTHCQYTRDIGTSYYGKVLSDMAIHETIATELVGQYFRTFVRSLGQSALDWGNMTSDEKGEVVSTEGSVEAPAGSVVTIEQAVGRCSEDGVTQTSLFRVTTSYKESETIRLAIRNCVYI